MSLPYSPPNLSGARYTYTGCHLVHSDRNVVQFATRQTGPDAPESVAIKSANDHYPWPEANNRHAAIRHEHMVLGHLVPVKGVPRVVELIEDRQGAVLVLSKVEGTSLHQSWANDHGNLPENWRHRISPLPGLARLLQAVNAQGWTHGDLTAHHAMVYDSQIALVDFGQACKTTAQQIGFHGTEPWFVPELMLGAASTGSPAATEAFVFGLLLYHGLTGEHVYPPDAREKFTARRWATTRARDEKLPVDITRDLRELVHRLVEPDPSKRGSIDHSALGTLDRELRSHARKVFHTSFLLNFPTEPKLFPLKLFVDTSCKSHGLAFSASSNAPQRLEACVVDDYLRLSPIGSAASGSVIVRLTAHEGTFFVHELAITVRKYSR